jgi:hypothetical protein
VSFKLRQIGPDDLLWRHLRDVHIKEDGVTVASIAYLRDSKPDPELSVDISDMTDFAKARIYRTGTKDPGLGIGEIQAAHPINMGFPVRHSPDTNPENPNPAHALILGGPNQTQARKLARQTKIVLYPNDELP